MQRALNRTVIWVAVPLAVLWFAMRMQNSPQTRVCKYIASRTEQSPRDTLVAFDAAARNVRVSLERQILNTLVLVKVRPVCRFLGEDEFLRTLGRFPPEVVLLTFARLSDEVHGALCKCIAAAGKNRLHNSAFLKNPEIDLQGLTTGLIHRRDVINDQIMLVEDCDRDNVQKAIWKPVPPLSFDNLPRLNSLSEQLPGEQSVAQRYAGIGGGGGSDIISASLIGHILRRHQKKMDMLISTRTWATGSQGKPGAKMGVKREVHDHDGQVYVNGKVVPGTFKVGPGTYAEGRDLEAIPIEDYNQIYIVLDQGESLADIPDADRAELADQFDAVLYQANQPVQTVLTVDTGGDVFGADTANTTPDQDLRVQRAISSLHRQYNLITAVVAPGVDAPTTAPEIAARAGGMVYRLKSDEKKELLRLLVKEYRMDGSDPSRYGKTTLALQARLKGKLGWTSVDLPEHVVNTWDNPWNSFIYIRECMEDIVLMPTVNLVPLIEITAQR